METDSGLAPKHPQQLIFENVSPATRLLEKRRQMYEVQDALENQKARFAREEETFRKKEEQLRAKDLQLQHQLFRFNKFLQDNEAKRRRAESRAADEAAQIKQREEEIRDLEKQLEESKQQCGELEDEVTKNMKYEEFLERVKDNVQEYSEIQDLVTRFETLESAHKDLMYIQSSSDDKIEELRNEYQSYQKEQDMEMLAMTNKVAQLQNEREEASRVRDFLAQQMDEASQEDSKHSLHFGQILMSVENLYLRCTSKRGGVLQHQNTTPMDEETKPGEVNDEDDTKDSFRRKQQRAIRQLRVILAYLRDFREMCEVLKKERRANTDRNKQNVTIEPARMPEPKFVVEAEAPRGDRGSHNSGSQGNTRELSKNTRDTTSGSGEGTSSGPRGGGAD